MAPAKRSVELETVVSTSCANLLPTESKMEKLLSLKANASTSGFTATAIMAKMEREMALPQWVSETASMQTFYQLVAPINASNSARTMTNASTGSFAK